MPAIYSVLSNEYCRLSEKLEDYKYKLENVDLTPELRDRIILNIESVQKEVIFIEKAFKANDMSLPNVRVPIDQMRGWAERIKKSESQVASGKCAERKIGIFTNE